MSLIDNEKLKSTGLSKAILERRSVRAYAQQRIDRSTIQTLLEAAVRAPTAIHEEPWAFVVVQDKTLLRKLSEAAKPLFVEEMRHRNSKGTNHSFEHFTRDDFDIFHGGDTLIIICARPVSQFVLADCWLAAENLMLAASAMELGTCVIGSAVAALNLHKMKAAFAIPDEYSAIVPIIVGVPSGKTDATARNEPLLLSWK